MAVGAVTLGLLAAPGLAVAAPSPTTIDARAMNSTITWGSHTVLTGTLMDTATITALGGLWLRVEWSATGSPASWTLFSTVTTETDAQYATGQYTQVVQPRKLTYYRFAFLGTAAYAASVSNPVTIKVRPFLGRPLKPSSVKKGQLFSVRGSLKPRFPAGAKTVRIKVYQYQGNRWIVVKRLAATNVDTATYSKYVLKTRLSTKGKYRFRAYTRATSAWAAGQSALSTMLTVK
jgi:hypothetical protein